VLDNDYQGFLGISGLPICGLATSMPLLCDSEASFLLTAQQHKCPATHFPCEMARPGAVFFAPTGDVTLILSCHVWDFMVTGKGAEMSANLASAKTNGTETSTPIAAAVPTGYRVTVVPGALEISARLGAPEEVRNLMKVLRAGILILEDTAEGDMDEPVNLTKRVAAIVSAPK
jgi:hypothetical protein